MTDILAALGLVLVLEGALYALFPEFMKRMAFKEWMRRQNVQNVA
jgi:uncharacterized protein YjeT (DUF2065 family)